MPDQNADTVGEPIRKQPKTVLIAHRKEVVADTLLSFFKSLPILAARATTPEEACSLFALLHPDLLIIGGHDEWLPLVEKWRVAHPPLEIIMLAESDVFAEKARGLGFENVVLADDSSESLADTMQFFLGETIAASPPAKEVSVIVVDDETEILDRVARYLRGCGYRVLTAQSGKSAIEMLERIPSVSIAVLDLVMPVFGGMETLKEMKRRNRSLGVIIMSSFADREIVREALDLGAFDFLLKPVDLNQLESSLVACLARMDFQKLSWWKRFAARSR
jgi:CheY-like chemotaxis protein